MRSGLLKVQADPADDLGSTGCVFDDSRRSLTCLLKIGVIVLDPAQAGIGVGNRGGNRLIDLVCASEAVNSPIVVTRPMRASSAFRRATDCSTPFSLPFAVTSHLRIRFSASFVPSPHPYVGKRDVTHFGSVVAERRECAVVGSTEMLVASNPSVSIVLGGVLAILTALLKTMRP